MNETNAACPDSLDGLYFPLINNLRTLASFDSCWLIAHLEGQSPFVAVTHHPAVQSKSQLAAKLQKLVQELPRLENPLILSRRPPVLPANLPENHPQNPAPGIRLELLLRSLAHQTEHYLAVFGWQARM